MYKEALLKKSIEEEEQTTTPQSTACTKLPSVEYFANFRDTTKSHETYSVTSTENTVRSKGMTPSESWADDDDEFMESVVQALSGSYDAHAGAKKAPRRNNGWKEVAKPREAQPSRRAHHQGGGGNGALRGDGGNAPSQQQLSGGRFDALARR